MSAPALSRSAATAGPSKGRLVDVLVLSVVVAGIALPVLVGTRYWLTLGMQVWVLAAYAYSYQLLFGRAGMLSFGHAVYFGLGAFATAHAMNSPWLAGLGFTVEAVPVIGMAAGLGAAIVFGFPSTRRAGTPFAMVTLGIGEMVAACFLMFPGFFGGEMGVTTDRTLLPSLLGQRYGAAQALYPLLLIWSFALIGLALWVGRTPLGLLARGVRDNAERLGFLGFEPADVRFRVMLVAGPLAGGAGALAAMLYEIVSVESVSLATSANVLLMTVVGGPASQVGPLVGALALTLMQTVLSKITHAWVFYYGLLFILVVLFAPNGLTGIGRATATALAQRGIAGFGRAYAVPIAMGGLAIAGSIVTIETLFHRSEGLDDGGPFPSWIAGLAALVTACCCIGLARRHGRRS